MGTDERERTADPRSSDSRRDGVPERRSSDSDGSPGDISGDGESTGSGRAPMSRRAFVLASGGAVGTAAAGFASDSGQWSTVTVTASEPYRAALSALAERDRSDATLDVRPASTHPLSALRDGAADLHVSGRPRIPSADGSAVSTARGAIAAGGGALVHDGAEWRECLGERELRARWRSDAPVETWSESDRAVAESADLAASGGSDVDHVVRGPRAYQYARGLGGVGYYAVDADEIVPGRDARRAASATPVVRVGYVHAGADTDDPVAALGADGSVGRRDDAVPRFTDPVV